MQRLEIGKWLPVAGMTEVFIKHVKSQKPQPTEIDPTAHNIKYNSGLGYLPLSIDIPIDIIRSEALAVVPYMIDLTPGDYDSHGWSNFSMFGVPLEDQGDWGHDRADSSMAWTPEALELMPRTVEYFDQVWPHKRFWRMRLLGLKPGGVIGVHNDHCAGMENINIGIDHPDQCEFYLEGSGRIPFANGKCFALDAGRRHAVINNSDQLRLHLVIHQTDNEQFEKLIVDSYKDYTKSLALV